MNGGFLLDTNVLSELTKPMPDVHVRDWVDAQDDANLYLSVVSVGELRRGFTILPLGKRRLSWNGGLNSTSFPCLPAESCQ